MQDLKLKKNNFKLFYPSKFFESIADEDEIVLDFFKHKKNGYCIDIGAADGVCINNCIKLFNVPYEWSGLSIEANPIYYNQLKYLFEGTDVKVYLGAIHPTDSEVIFYQMIEELITPEKWECLSGHSNITGKSLNIQHNQITVSAKPINDILLENNVPEYIDFISMDIEGSENYVLDNWNFDKYKVKMWCIENGELYDGVLYENGYVRYESDGYKTNHNNRFYVNNNI
jgi:FkbM family methyltransferase